MKTLFTAFVRVVPLVGAMLAGGCATILSEKAFVQDATVNAPVGHLPVRLAGQMEPGHVVITPMLSAGRRTRVDGLIPEHTGVGPRGLYAVDTIRNSDGSLEFTPGNNPYGFKGSNFHWKTPAFTAGLAVDIPLSRSVAVAGGLTYAGAPTGDTWGGHLGMGFRSEGPVLGMRLDAGVQWTPVAYTVASVVETEYQKAFSSSRYTRSTFFRDEGTGAPFGWYGSLTLNTRVPEWPVNPFVGVSLTRQRFFSYEPKVLDPYIWIEKAPEVSDAKVDAGATLVTLSPGLAFTVGPSQRLLIGARFAMTPEPINEENTSLSLGPVVMPFIQIDIGL